MVNRPHIPRLIDLVRSTLQRVEKSEHCVEKDAAVQGLRRSVVRTIAEHELRTGDSADSVPADPKPEDTAA